ncbi:hypothetical protein HJ590_15255 [Naumannella sp. ID2617S]|nr:hypothetical protein [Naumannella sp. ID2617S]
MGGTDEVRFFEVPWHAQVGRLVNPELGLRSVALRGGENAPYDLDVTVLDAPDHRLVRAGIWLAHRVLDGRGEWYLAAEGWQPHLPAERIEQMGHADLPDELADLVRPFRRGAALGPVAALAYRREEYALRGPDTALVAVLRNEQVQIRTGGVTTARYRQLTLTGHEGRLTGRQVAWLTGTLGAVGAIRVPEFPTLAQRLGAPATGLSDLPGPRSRRAEDSLESYVASLLTARLRRLTQADLAVRAGQPGAASELMAELVAVRSHLLGLVPLLDPGWVGDLVGELEWASRFLSDHTELTARPAELSGERYLQLLDRLVQAGRAPALGDSGTEPAGPVLTATLRRRLRDLRLGLRGIRAEGPDLAWQQALQAAERLVDCCGVQADQVRAVKQLRRRASRLVNALTDCLEAHHERATIDLAPMTPQQAFEAGRAYERVAMAEHDARLDVIDEWPELERRLRRLGKEL